MPRPPRLVIPDVPHHVTHRGNNGREIFLTDFDRQDYISILKSHSQRNGLRVIGWCLMRNHIHLIVLPSDIDSLAVAIGRAHNQYAIRFNKKHNIQDHLWHARFYSSPLDERHMVNALKYVDRNPVRAGLVLDASLYRWSSAAFHAGVTFHDELIDRLEWGKIDYLTDWKSLIESEDDGLEMNKIRRCTRTGMPLGSDEFIERVKEFSASSHTKSPNQAIL